MSKKLKTNNNNTSSSNVPQWSSSSEEEEQDGLQKVVMLEAKSPKKIIILERAETKVSKKSSGSESNAEQQTKIINLSAADNASLTSKGEALSSPPNLEKDFSGRLITKTATLAKEETKNFLPQPSTSFSYTPSQVQPVRSVLSLAERTQRLYKT